MQQQNAAEGGVLYAVRALVNPQFVVKGKYVIGSSQEFSFKLCIWPLNDCSSTLDYFRVLLIIVVLMI